MSKANFLELIKSALSEDLDDLRQKSVTPKAPDLDLDITSSAIDLLQDKIRRSGDEARANEVELSRLDGNCWISSASCCCQLKTELRN